MSRIVLLLPLLLIDVIQCRSQTLNYYFGNLHSHTGFSDGNKDSISSGISTPFSSYQYAKLSEDFDFLGISEHNHFSSSKNPGFRLPRYQEGLNMADAQNEDDDFLCLFGMEYGVSSKNNGHVIIYGFNQLIGWEVGVGGSTGPNYGIYNAKGDYVSLFRKVKNNPSSFCYLAHPWWTDFSADGTDSTALAFSKYNSMYDSAIVGVPLRSGNAFSEFDDYSDYSTSEYFNYYKKLLNLGYHIGMGYDHDNHYTNFGRSNGGRLVVLMPSLSRSNLVEAMQQRRFYGSDDANARLHFTLNGFVMGSVNKGNKYPAIEIRHDDPDGEIADTIRLWKGFKNGPAWAYTIELIVGSNNLLYTDFQVYPGTEYYYFAEIRQKDGQWIVGSPIWYRPEQDLNVNSGLNWNATGVVATVIDSNVEIVCSAELNGEFELRDYQGRQLKSGCFSGKQTKIDISNLLTGLYVLQVRSKSVVKAFRILKD